MTRAEGGGEWGGGGWQGSDLSDREIATWFKWLACSRQSLDRRVNWLLSYLQSSAAALTCPTQPRADLSPSLCPIFAMSLSPSLTHTHAHRCTQKHCDGNFQRWGSLWSCNLFKYDVAKIKLVFHFATLYQHFKSHIIDLKYFCMVAWSGSYALWI